MTKLLLLVLAIPGMSLTVLAIDAVQTGQVPGIGALIAPVLIILFLVLVNGFFVAAEFAIIGVRPTQIEQSASEGNKRAQGVLRVLQSRSRQDSYIATAQLGITIASLGLAMYGEPQISHFVESYLARYFEISESFANSIGYFIALGVLTYLHVVLGEMVPKTLALLDAFTMAQRLAAPMRLALLVLILPVRILNGIGNLLLRILRIRSAHGQARLLASEELELLVTESAEGGLLQEEEEEMIRNIFDFGERTVGQVMTPRTKVQAIPIDIGHEELVRLTADSPHSRFPVYEGDLDHIVGIMHLKDLIRQLLKGSVFDLRLILRVAPAVPENQSVELLLAALKRLKLHMAVVLDEFGGMAGVITLEDLVEEVVGEVRDEFDQEKEPYVQIAPGVLEVAGDYLVDDLVDEVYLGEPDDLPDVETVGGLVIARLGRPPQVGDEAIYNEQVRFRVLDVDRRAISRVRIDFPVPPPQEKEARAPAANDGVRPQFT
jgi:CBS domain containing-hemolysin-like protein